MTLPLFIDAPPAGPRLVTFARDWRAMDHRLPDGTRIAPTLRVCADAYRYLRAGMPWYPVVITEGSYTLRNA